MSILTWPTLSGNANAPRTWDFGLRSSTQVSVSDLSGYVQTVELPGARWTANGGYAPLERVDAAVMEVFFAQLRGQANRANVPVFGRRSPRGTWAGSPTVNNEVGSPTLSQTGTTLYLAGFTAAATVKKGDYFNIGSGGELKIITADGTADGSGLLQVSLEPPIRTAPAHGVAIVSTNCTCLMMLSDPHSKWGMKEGGFTDFAFDFVEVFA